MKLPLFMFVACAAPADRLGTFAIVDGLQPLATVSTLLPDGSYRVDAYAIDAKQRQNVRFRVSRCAEVTVECLADGSDEMLLEGTGTTQADLVTFSFQYTPRVDDDVFLVTSWVDDERRIQAGRASPRLDAEPVAHTLQGRALTQDVPNLVERGRYELSEVGRPWGYLVLFCTPGCSTLPAENIASGTQLLVDANATLYVVTFNEAFYRYELVVSGAR